jgi:hypothetical protein
MGMTKKQVYLGAAMAGLLLLGLGLPRAIPAYRRWREDARWQVWMDDALSANQTLHANHWDSLNQVLAEGGLAPLPWAHFSSDHVPRQSFRLRAWFKVAQPNRPAWLKLIAASPVQYFNVADAGAAAELPRSRYAGFFGRVDLSPSGNLLSAGQEDLEGQGFHVASAPATTPLQDPVLQLTFEDERLTVQWGDGKAQTLARELFLGQGPDLQFGLSGENSIVTRLQVLTRKDPGDLKAEAEADGYALVGKAHMAEPIYRDLAQAQTQPDARDRYELRQAQELFLATHRDDAEALLKALIARDPLGFYAGYAKLDLVKVRQQQGALVDELGEILASLYDGQPQHPEAGAARLLDAQLLALQPSSLPKAQRLALDALKGGDPAVQAQALDFLSSSPTAIAGADLVAELRPLAQAPGASPVLVEALALRQAQAQAQAHDIAALAETCLEAQGLAQATRIQLYQLLTQALEQVQPPLDAAGAWSALGLKQPQGDYLLRDLLSCLGFSRYFTPASQGSIRPILMTLAAVLVSHVHQREAAKPALSERRFTDLSQDPLPASYGYLPQDAPSLDGDEVCLVFKSGTYWGCGLSFAATQAPRLPGGAVDLSGYKFLQAELWAPKGCETFLSISESGVADPKSDRFDGEAGADGEQYLFPVVVGTGDWQALKLPLDQVGPALNWGNPHGNLTLDLQAIQKIDLAIPGKQGVGRACLRKIRFSVE